VTAEYEFPEKTPKFVRDFLKETFTNVHSILRDNLVGIHLYGSLAMGCFNPKSSDMDIILVVKKRLSNEQKRSVIEYLKGIGSKDKRIELSIVREIVVRNPQYPLMVDLHFEYWREVFENEKDKEILSNLYTTRKRGFCVWGKQIGDVFSEIPAEYHLMSVIEDLEHTRKYLHDNPKSIGYDPAVYWILGSCRILAFIREGKLLSKLEGGRWGLANLPEEYHDVVEQALSCYKGKKKEQIRNHEKLEAFADYMTTVILRESALDK
jgi:streptomycin 3"-adenylyltransferase